jgi:hypothetical protein
MRSHKSYYLPRDRSPLQLEVSIKLGYQLTVILVMINLETPTTVYLKDYAVPPFLIPQVRLPHSHD